MKRPFWEHNLNVQKIEDEFVETFNKTAKGLAEANQKMAEAFEKEIFSDQKEQAKEQAAELDRVTKSTLDFVRALDQLAVATAKSDPRGFITEIREISAEEEKLKQQIAELNALLAQPQNASNLALKTELVETETELAKLQSQMQQLQPTWSQTWAQMTASAQNDILQISWHSRMHMANGLRPARASVSS